MPTWRACRWGVVYVVWVWVWVGGVGWGGGQGAGRMQTVNGIFLLALMPSCCCKLVLLSELAPSLSSPHRCEPRST